MSPIQELGRARLKLRLPAWRVRFDRASSPSFLEVCEAYELAWIGLDYWRRSETANSPAIVADYRELIASLELDAKLFASQDIDEI
jgi:hypothetical protein